MIALLKNEHLKSRHGFLFTMTAAFAVVQLLFAFYGTRNMDQYILDQGWMMILYQMPVLNVVFLPVFTASLTSRLCDLEHKNHMLKLLCTHMEKSRLFQAKFLYGFGFVLLYTILHITGIYLCGRICGFPPFFPLEYYTAYFGFTLLTSTVIYLIQFILSIMLTRQTVPFIIGILGSFIGMFSMFLPQLPFLRRAVPWGYYGVFMFIGNNWTKETRINEFYFMNYDTAGVITLLAVFILLFAAGCRLFCKKEL